MANQGPNPASPLHHTFTQTPSRFDETPRHLPDEKNGFLHQGFGTLRQMIFAVFALLACLLSFGVAISSASAQPVARETFQAWQIQCETPTGSQVELCALVQNVAAVDRPNVELRVTVVKTLDGGAHILRVAVPLGVLLDGGLGLRIDDTDIGTADFARCLPSGCYVEMIMDQNLIASMSNGQMAWFVIFQTPDEGIGIPIDLPGFADGFAALN